MTLASALAGIVGERHVRSAPAERLAYAMDGLPTHRRLPALAVLPGTRDEVIAVVRLLADLDVPFVPRGAGTGLSGGAHRSEEHTSELQSHSDLVCRLLLEKKKGSTGS